MHLVQKCCHNPYFSRWFSAIKKCITISNILVVTILILVDGFLQLFFQENFSFITTGHNPYFSRWFSAIRRDDNDK